MYKIDKYLDFLLEKNTLGKLRIYYSDKLREMFKEIKFRDPGNIVSILLNIENKDEYLDSYTLVDVTDKNDTISFIQVNRIIRGEGWTEDHSTELDSSILDKDNDYWKKARTSVGLGRWATRVISEVYNKIILPSDVSRLVDFYRSVFDEENLDLYEVVSGEEIKKWYLEDNYYKNIGQLGNSCMKHDYCQDYFSIYTENPEVCKLLVYFKDTTKTKILGRSLLWKLTNGKIYQDRIYASYDSDILKMKEWAKSKGYLTRDDLDDTTSYVQVKAKDYIEYPYMDTFLVYNMNTGLLSNDEDLWPDEGYIKLQETDGTYQSDQVVWSNYNDEYISKDQAIKAIGKNGEDYFYKQQVHYIKGVYYQEDLVSFSSTLKSYVLNREAVWSRVIGDTLDPDDERVIKIYQDRDKKLYDWSTINHPETWVKEGDTYYHSNFYIKNPYGDGYIFIKENKDLRNKIEKELNIPSLKDVTTEDYRNIMVNIIKDIYENDDYDKEYVINYIINSKRYKEGIQGIYWGFTKEENIKPENLILAILVSSITNWSYDFEEVAKLINAELGDLYNKYKRRNIWLGDRIKNLYLGIDYSKVSDRLYKLYLYNKVLL